jgi:hypothetical protein
VIDRHEVGGELVDDDAVVDVEGLLHRRRGNVERPDQERLDQERDEQRRQEDEQHVAHEDLPAATLARRRRNGVVVHRILCFLCH